MAVGRFAQLGAGLLTQSIGGIMYAYALYSTLLKHTFDLNQEKTDLISTMMLVGCNFGIHIGWLYDRAGKAAPVAVLLLALVLGVGGWVPMWAILQFDMAVPFGVILLLSFCQGHAQMAIDIATISTLVRSFPEHRGLVIALLKSYVGLSGALVSQVFAGGFRPLDDNCGGTSSNSSTTALPALAAADSLEALLAGQGASGGESEKEACRGTITFLLFLGCEVLVVCLIGASLIRQRTVPPETSQSHEQVAAALRTVLYATMGLALLTAGASFAEYALPSDIGYEAAGFLAAVYLSFFGVIAVAVTRQGSDLDRRSAVDATDRVHAPLLGEDTGAVNKGDADEKDVAETESVPSYTLGQALCTPYFWIICISFLVGGGSGLVINANLAQIIPTTINHPSFDSSPSTVKKTIFVTLFSVCNCFGRLLAGLLGDFLLKRRGIPRPAVFALALVGMSASLCLAITGHYVLLFPAIILCGLSYGAFNSLCPTLISEIFGLQNFAIIYATNSIGLAVGSYALATTMAGQLYAKHAQDSEHNCTDGAACYRLTFIICAIGCAVMSLFMLALVPMIRLRYRKLYPSFYRSKAASRFSEDYD